MSLEEEGRGKKADLSQLNEKRQPSGWVTGLSFALLVVFLVILGLGLHRAQSGTIVIGQSVPAFTLTTFESGIYNTADLSGKVIVVNFWASWCQPCEQEAREMEAAWQHYKPGGRVIFLGIDYVDTEPEALAFLQKFGVTYPNGPDLRTKISQMFRIRGVPETYIINKDGRLAYIKKGPFRSLAEIQSVIDPLLE